MSDKFGVDQHIRTPYMENYNMNLQQELSRHMVLQIGYVGSQGHKLFRFRDLNQPSKAHITAADLAASCINRAPERRRFTRHLTGKFHGRLDLLQLRREFRQLQLQRPANQLAREWLAWPDVHCQLHLVALD